MKAYLKTIQDRLQQATPLSEEDKQVLLKALSEADKQWYITDFKLERTEQIKRTTTTLLEETIEELEQKRKAVEAQNRELEIETALERVRAQTMAMQKSDELQQVVHTVFERLNDLKVELYTAIIIIFTEGSKEIIWWLENKERQQYPRICIRYTDIQYLRDLFEAKEKGLSHFSKCYRAEEKKDLYQYLFELDDFKDVSEQQKKFLLESEFATMSVALAKNTGIHLTRYSNKPFSDEDNEILKRFAKVFDQAYVRFRDLQLAEANAKEAVKQASLDRIRADIASMRSVSDLDKITPLIWNELTILGVPFTRCGVFIMDASQELIHTFLSTPEGKAIAAFHLSYAAPGNIGQVVNYWRNKNIFVDYWTESDFTEFAATLIRQGVLAPQEPYMETIPQGGFYLHFLPFLQGMLYVGNTTRLGEEELSLIQSVADAFSTAYARYEDFNKLEAAKQQVEKTLVDLKQAQTQLVQSEKMASLGELTAGIAHEIQNPLNFVNNFSEVSNELLGEMEHELAAGNQKEALLIAEDLKQNLEKIIQHGKRADSIVKGMLQHSRNSTGQKEPTDINKLVDEYLRLAYHGFRAKITSFNVTLHTDFEETIGLISILPQDLGRALLNIINNAFYAVAEKKRKQHDGYDPAVWVGTKKQGDKLEITIRDNGDGISQKVLDKIFQPFFTTKPTGEGTGLGLSLTYEIITKGHDGDIKVKTMEQEGTEFIITLPFSGVREPEN